MCKTYLLQHSLVKKITIKNFKKSVDKLCGIVYTLIKLKEGRTTQMFKVSYKEIDTTEIITEVMDGQTLGYYLTDWAYEVVSYERV